MTESNFTELETLPNIDINIKCGNSLVSRFAIDADLKQALKKSKWTIDSYRLAVDTYRNAKSREQKREMERLILEIKQSFSSEIRMNDPLKKRLDKLANELYHRFTGTFLFEPEKAYGNDGQSLEKKKKNEQQKVEKEIEELNKKIDEIKANKIFANAFEWRFEFPEVLNNEGDFLGFDVVIGNPPYFSMSKIKEYGSQFQAAYVTYSKSADIYCLFYEKGIQLLKQKGILTYITSNSWLRTQYGQKLRTFLVENTNPIQLINIEDTQIFEDATVESNIIEIEKSSWKQHLKAASLKSDFKIYQSLQKYFQTNSRLIKNLAPSGWTIGDDKEAHLKNKIEEKGPLLRSSKTNRR